MNQNDPIREQFERFKQEERTWNYAEALYWMNQYKNLLEQALAVEPDKLEVRKILVSAHNSFVALSGLTQNSTALHVIKEQSRQLKVALAKHGGST